jgi:phage portal protein BeeE
MNIFQKYLTGFQRNIAQESGSQSSLGALFGRSSSGKQVNEQTAMQASAGLCLCQDSGGNNCKSSAPYLPKKHLKVRKKLIDHYLYELLHSEPNPEISAFTFFENNDGSNPDLGKRLCIVVRDVNGKVLELWPLKPEKMQVGDLRAVNFFTI